MCQVKKWKRAGVIITAGVCIVAGIWGYFIHAKKKEKGMEQMPENEKNSVVYVAIGDSITYGYSLENRERERFSARIASYMDEHGMAVVECNQGVSGQVSAELLRNIEQQKVDLLDRADYVTICIGTNDALLPFEFFLLNYADCFYTYNGADDTSELWERMDKTAFLKEFDEAEQSVCENLDGFYDNLSGIIDAIREENPDCQIAVMTLYNPYRDMDYQITADNQRIHVGEYAESKIAYVNDIIRMVCQEKDVILADCYTAFASSDEMVLNNQTADWYLDADDHPTAAGQQLIADVFIDAMFSD